MILSIPIDSATLAENQIKIVHLSTVHEAIDNRILEKECHSLAQAGYDVRLVAQHPRDERIKDVEIRGLVAPESRLVRLTVTWAKALWMALRERPRVVHFHDPELLPAAFLLRLFGIITIYDVHEDYVTSLRDKRYLGWLRWPAICFLAVLENVVGWFSHVVLAERSYLRRFPQGHLVLNYPVRLDGECTVEDVPAAATPLPYSNRLLFTGGIHPNRGALLHANLVNLSPHVEVHLVGRIDAETREQVLDVAGDNADRISIEGDERLVPFSRITEHYRTGSWLAGLAIFPHSPDHYGKELTKFFEYMAAGIPILCSNFPVWRALVEKHECGLCVDPDDPASIRDALRELINCPEEAKRLGRNGKQAVHLYRWSDQADRLVNLYDGILNNS